MYIDCLWVSGSFKGHGYSSDLLSECIKDCAKHPHIDEDGYVLYYTNQCPFNAKYVPVLEETAKNNGIPFRAVKIESRNDSQNAPTPVTTYAMFCEGQYITNEQMNDKKFLKLAQ